MTLTFMYGSCFSIFVSASCIFLLAFWSIQNYAKQLAIALQSSIIKRLVSDDFEIKSLRWHPNLVLCYVWNIINIHVYIRCGT